MITDYRKHPYFGAEYGTLEIIPFYADNEICCQELSFCVPASEWSEFEKSQLFRDLVDFVQSLVKHAPETHSPGCGTCDCCVEDY